MLLVLFASTGFGQDESAYVKLLKKAPEGRMAQILDVIGKRGTLADLAFVYDRATAPEGFPIPVRARAFEILEEAGSTRGLRPPVDLAPLARLIGSSETPALRRAAIRLAGSWKAEATVSDLREVAGAKLADLSTRAAAFGALASIGGEPARAAIDALCSSDRPAGVRGLAVAALARFDLDLAAEKAAATLTDDARAEDVTPLIAAFLDRQGGVTSSPPRWKLASRPPTAPAWRSGRSTPSAGPTRSSSPSSLEPPGSRPRRNCPRRTRWTRSSSRSGPREIRGAARRSSAGSS